MTILRQKYQQEIIPELQKKLKLANVFAVPKLEKIVLNIGVAQPQDPRARSQVIDNVVQQLALITGQKPVVTTAKKSIANFKLRAGDPMGVKVTLRGDRMWHFLEKLISIALPRVKDFRGIPINAFDGQGNYALGIDEQIIFPEINYDKIDSIRSLQVIMVTSAKDNQSAHALLKMLGMPFEKEQAN